MLRWFFVLLPLLAGASASANIAGGPIPVAPLPTGPCDVVSCAAAYSVTRALKQSYSGKLFQLSNGSSTFDVGTSGGAANLSGIATFCSGVVICAVSKIYDQSGNGVDLIPVTGNPQNSPTYCTTGNTCASTFLLDPYTGLPVIVTTYPSEYDVNDTFVNSGASPLSIFWYGRNEQYPGQFGIGHPPASPNVNGTNFLSTIAFNNTAFDAGYFTCPTATGECVGMDEEASTENNNHTGTNYATSTQEDISVLSTWSGTNRVEVYVNSSTPIINNSPPSSVTDGAALVPGQHIKIGCGGDCIHSQIIWREGFLTNSLLSGTDYTNIANNVSAFYGAHTTPATCSGGADLEYFTSIKALGGADWGQYQPGPTSAIMSYSLAQIRASYFGPIADLYNGSTTQTFNSALAAGGAGCGLDPAAVTFCAGGCTVSKLYHQSMWTSHGVLTQNDTSLDVVFTTGHQPSVTFNSLNGLPTMHFTGSQYGCASPTTTLTAYYGFSAVARRTSVSGFVNALYMSNIQVGFDTTGNAGFYGGTSIVDQAATEAHWHAIMYENGTGNPFVDGVTGTGPVNASTQANSQFCIGAKGDTTQALTGDIAEVDAFAINNQASAGYASRGSKMFSAMQATWGTLPN